MSITEVRPKESKGTLEPMANTIAVANGMLFDYYAIKLGEKKGPFVELIKVPPLIVEGFVTVGKQLYVVGFKDYIRRRVNVSSPYRAAVATNQSTANDVVETVSNRDQSTVSQCADPAIDQAANLAWKEQIDSLLHADDPEEEWEY